jgi:hypothetical protein
MFFRVAGSGVPVLQPWLGDHTSWMLGRKFVKTYYVVLSSVKCVYFGVSFSHHQTLGSVNLGV